MFTLVGLGGALVVALLRGGRPRHAGTVQLRLLPLLLLVLWADVVVALRGGDGAATVAVLLLHQGAVVAVPLANVVLRGMPVVLAGAVANALVVLANTGMPVAPAAVRWLGSDPDLIVLDGAHHLADGATRFVWLADVVPVPLLDVVVSLGDVLVVAGLAVVIDEVLRPRAPGGFPSRPAA